MVKEEFDFDAVADGVSDYIKDLFENVPDELKADIAIVMSFEVVNQASYNMVEAIGILEVTKATYIEAYSRAKEEDIQKSSN